MGEHGVQAFDFSTWETFKTSLVHSVNSRTAGDIWRERVKGEDKE